MLLVDVHFGICRGSRVKGYEPTTETLCPITAAPLWVPEVLMRLMLRTHVKDWTEFGTLPDFLMALPIKGEAFVLRREEKTVLVDGGLKQDRVADVLHRELPDVHHLDIVVCTHGDRDHAGGLPDLLDKWGNRIRQVWLPGRWVDVVPQLIQSPGKFLTDLVNEFDVEMRQSSDRVQLVLSDEQSRETGHHGDSARETSFPMDNNLQNAELTPDWPGDDFIPKDFAEPPMEPEWFSQLRRTRDRLNNDDAIPKIFDAARSRMRRRARRNVAGMGHGFAQYCLGLIDTAQAIRGIAVAAIRHNIMTRWFDFEAFSNTRHPLGGIPGFLVPVNAVEQTRLPVTDSLFLLLTKINRESLVFFAPSRSQFHFEVLFCADSPLGDGPSFNHSFLCSLRRPRRPLVATAPHHGSESNCIAYSHLKNWGGAEAILRAGGNRDHPGTTFLNQNYSLRLCAKCPRRRQSPLLTGLVEPMGVSAPLLLGFKGRLCTCSVATPVK